LLIGALVGCAEKAKPQLPPAPTVVSGRTEGKDSVTESQLTTVTATVVAVDQAKRDVTLRGPKGRVETIHVGDEVRNLPQVHKGDLVVVKYYEAVTAQLKKKGQPDVVVAEGADRAAVGQKPGAAGAAVVSVTAKVIAVDKKNQQITLRGPEGRTAVVDVKQPRYLDVVKKGDLVDITYTEALAVAVEPAAKN
jgi:aspartate 1-decarboxylase